MPPSESERLTRKSRIDPALIAAGWEIVPLTQDKFLNLKISVPPLVEQREIVRRAERILGLADGLEVRYANAQRHLAVLRAALLSRAFSGQLTGSCAPRLD